MLAILPRDWNLEPIFTQKWAPVDTNWGFNLPTLSQPPAIPTLFTTLEKKRSINEYGKLLGARKIKRVGLTVAYIIDDEQVWLGGYISDPRDNYRPYRLAVA